MCNSCKGITPHLSYEQTGNKRTAIEKHQNSSSINQVIHLNTSLNTELPNDVLLLILKPFQETHESPFMRLVCKQWNSLISHKPFLLKDVAYYYAKRSNMAALKYLEQVTTK